MKGDRTEDIGFSSAYAAVYQTADDTPDTFRFSSEYGEICYTFLRRKIPWTVDGQTYYDIVTPYGYGGPAVIRCTNIDRLMKAYQKAFFAYCRANRYVCEFVRFHLFDNVEVRERYYGTAQAILDNVVVNTAEEYETIRARYKPKVRQNVRKALRNGLTVISENSLDRLSDFLSIYYATMDRRHAKPFYYFDRTFFENIDRLLPDHYRFFFVMKDEKPIAADLVLRFGQRAYFFLGGTLEEYYPYRPNDLLKDTVIGWCCQNGVEQFILGGGHRNGDGVYRYKRSFSGDPDVPFYVGRAVFDPDIYDRLVAMRRAEDPDFDGESAFFPLYRA